MKSAQLGHSDLCVSQLGLGTVQLGMAYGYDNQPPPSDNEAIHLIRHALDLGINYIDTAAGYGRSETLVGKACADLSPKPIIATKLSITHAANGHILTGGALRQAIEESMQHSLQTLKLDTLDLLQLHSLQQPFTTPELLTILDDYRDRGWVRHWGVTTYGAAAPLDALVFSERFCSLQVPYSVLDRRMESLVFPRARAQGTGVILRSVFLQGVLSDRLDALPPHLTTLQMLAAPFAQLAREAGMGLGELALRFAAFSPCAHSTIFGTTSIGELEANVRAIAAGPLSPELAAAVRAIEITDFAMLNPSNWQR